MNSDDDRTVYQTMKTEISFDSDAAIRDFLAEHPADCSYCGKTAYVTGEERSRGKWTCYSCGGINRWVKK